MRALVLDRFGLEHLRLAHLPDPDPARLAAGEVLLRIRATTLNHRDLRVVAGTYDPRFQLPLVPCSDATAEVVALGEAVTRLSVGDRVLPAFAPRWLSGPPRKELIRATWGAPLPGTACEFLVAPASCLVGAPEHLDDVEASALCCAGATAYRALVDLPELSAGGGNLAEQWVLCLGTGGVSVFAAQIARALGARVAVTSSDDAKLNLMKELGADLTINYRTTPDWGRHVRSATGGVHHVVEVGGAETLAHSLRAILPGGTISLIGVLSGRSAPLDLAPVLMNQIRIQGVLAGPRSTLARVAEFYERHRLRPHVHETYSLDDGVAAFQALASQGHVGKVGIRVTAAD